MSTLRRKRAPPAFVRWWQLLLATMFAKGNSMFGASLARRLRRVPGRSQAAPRGRSARTDFAPTQVLKRSDDLGDERWLSAGDGVDVSEQDLETLPAELREALLGDHRRARRRGETTAVA